MMNHNDIFNAILQSEHWRELPEIMQQTVMIVDAPEKQDVDGLVAAIESNPELASIVLKNMNSAFYTPYDEVTNVRSAVVLLGFEAIRNFMASYMTNFILPDSKRHRKQFNMHEYWNHSLATSIAADLLGEKIGFTDRFKLFTCGLVHDIGLIVLEAYLPEMVDAIVEKIHTGVPQMVAERAVLGGITHADVGAWLCRQWNLDAAVRDIIEFHHTPALAPKQTTELHLMYLGNIIGTRIYESAMQIRLGRNPIDSQILSSLNLTEADIADVDDQLDEKMRYFSEHYISL